MYDDLSGIAFILTSFKAEIIKIKSYINNKLYPLIYQ